MNFINQRDEWLAKHKNATPEEIWTAGYMTCTDNWCHGKTDMMAHAIEILTKIINT